MNSAELPLCHHEYPDRTVCRLPKGHDSNTHGDPTEQPKADIPLVITDADLHPDTARLVTDFAQALADKLLAAEMKYGYSNGWMNWDWMDECRDKLREHLAKGDPRDVAAYCAFLWFHGEPTAKKTEQALPAVNGQTDYVIERAINEWWAEKNRDGFGEDKIALRDLRHKIMEHLSRG